MNNPKRSTLAVATFTALTVTLVVASLASRQQPRSNTSNSENGGSANGASSLGRSESLSSAWAEFRVQAREVEYYRDLAQMSQSASAVVRGTVIAVEEGRVFGLEDAEAGGAVRYVLLHVAIDAVSSGDDFKAGEVALVELGPVELSIDVKSEFAGLVGDQGIFFLRLKGEGAPSFEVPADPVERSLGYYRMVSSQGLFLNDSGTVELGIYADAEGFPSQFSGDSFDDFAKKVDAA